MDDAERPFLGRGARSPYPLSTHLRRLLWRVAYRVAFRPSPRRLYGWRRVILRAFGAEITGEVKIYPSADIYFPWHLSACGPLLVGPEVNVYNLAPIRLERGCIVSQRVHLCSGSHDYNRIDFPLVFRPIVIGENAWIAAEVFVGPGVTVGAWSVVGARAVVTKSIPGAVVVAGNPARVLKTRDIPGKEAFPKI